MPLQWKKNYWNWDSTSFPWREIGFNGTKVVFQHTHTHTPSRISLWILGAASTWSACQCVKTISWMEIFRSSRTCFRLETYSGLSLLVSINILLKEPEIQHCIVSLILEEIPARPFFAVTKPSHRKGGSTQITDSQYELLLQDYFQQNSQVLEKYFEAQVETSGNRAKTKISNANAFGVFPQTPPEVSVKQEAHILVGLVTELLENWIQLAEKNPISGGNIVGQQGVFGWVHMTLKFWPVQCFATDNG